MQVLSGFGKLPGECMIQTYSDKVSAINPPSRLLVSLRGKVKAKLDTMVVKQKQIISPVMEPTPWVSGTKERWQGA